MRVLTPSLSAIEEAVRVLRADGVVAYPTDTVYGLAVNPFSKVALKKLWTVKGRPETKPVLVVIGALEHLKQICPPLSEKALSCIVRFWPGPLSLLLPRLECVPEELTAGSPKICVRYPDNELAQLLCRTFGGPVTSSSANRSGQPPVSSIGEINFPGIDLGIDGGNLTSQTPSTIFDPEESKIIREGAISASVLLAHPDSTQT